MLFIWWPFRCDVRPPPILRLKYKIILLRFSNCAFTRHNMVEFVVCFFTHSYFVGALFGEKKKSLKSAAYLSVVLQNIRIPYRVMSLKIAQNNALHTILTPHIFLCGFLSSAFHFGAEEEEKKREQTLSNTNAWVYKNWAVIQIERIE